MKKNIVYCILLIVFLTLSGVEGFSQDFNAPKPKPQQEKKPFWSWDRVYGGGGMGMSFTGTTSFINLAPIVGYRITDKYSAGFGITYLYFHDRFFSPPVTLNAFGGNIFNRYLLTHFLFAHAEYEVLNGNWDLTDRRFNLQNVWVGGGLRQHAGNSSIMIMALWNLNENDYSNYYFHSPQIRIGFSIGL